MASAGGKGFAGRIAHRLGTIGDRLRSDLAGPARAVVAFAMGLVAFGVLLRVAAPFFMDIWMDGAAYAAMGDAFRRNGEFLMPWGDVTGFACAPPQYSHHYPPLYPLYLAGIYEAFGFGLWQTKLAASLVALAALAAVWACTANLYGRRPAWLVAAFFAVEPTFVWAAGTGFAENMVLLAFTLASWAIVKSLRRERYIMLAGLFAGLGYLSRAGMGAFFLVAGVAGLFWRLRYMGLRLFRSKPYLAAIAIFGVALAVWAGRNVARFGWPHWETSAYTTRAQEYALDHPDLLAYGLAVKLVLFAAFVAVFAIPLAPELRRGLRELRREDESVLWLSFFLVLAIGWILSSIQWTIEGYGAWWINHQRYAVIAFLPLLWAFARRAGVAAQPPADALPTEPLPPDAPARSQAERRHRWMLGAAVAVQALALGFVFQAQVDGGDVGSFAPDRWTAHLPFVGAVPTAWLILAFAAGVAVQVAMARAHRRRAGRHDAASALQPRFAGLAVGLALLSTLMFFAPTQVPEARAFAALDERLHPGDEVGIEGNGWNLRYVPYLYTSHQDLFVYGCIAARNATGHVVDACPGQQPKYIVSLFYKHDMPGYHLIDSHTIHYLNGDPSWTGYTYERNEPKPTEGPGPPGCNL